MKSLERGADSEVAAHNYEMVRVELCAIRFFQFKASVTQPGETEKEDKSVEERTKNFRIESEKRGIIIIRVQKTLKFAKEDVPLADLVMLQTIFQVSQPGLRAAAVS